LRINLGRHGGRAAIVALGILLLAGGPTAPAAGDEAAIEELRRAVAVLQAELTRRADQPAPAAETRELERRIELLAGEIEALRSGGAAEAAGAGEALEGEKGLSPAASKVYRRSRGVSIGGYGEALYTNYASRRQDDAPSAAADQFDFVRQIVYLGYKFGDSVLFNSEIEVEHGSTGKGGEVSVEFAYVELQRRKELGLRAGMLLVPMGFLNELHEPPVYRGARRPEVESAIIPSTWRENGAGLFGEAGPLAWRAYVVAGLSSAGINASGIRGGRQSGARSRAEDLAFTGRLDWTGLPGLLVGGSFFSGETGQGAVVEGQPVGGRVTLYDLHAQYERRGLRLRGLWARSTLADAALVNRQNQLAGKASVGGAQAGWYAEASYDLMTHLPRQRWSLLPFVRYEWLDTQNDVPAGFEEDPARERTALTAGVELKPLPQVVFKADYQWLRNEARTGANQLNLAVGYLF
jgi:hypothetical protein